MLFVACGSYHVGDTPATFSHHARAMSPGLKTPMLREYGYGTPLPRKKTTNKGTVMSHKEFGQNI